MGRRAAIMISGTITVPLAYLSGRPPESVLTLAPRGKRISLNELCAGSDELRQYVRGCHLAECYVCTRDTPSAKRLWRITNLDADTAAQIREWAESVS